MEQQNQQPTQQEPNINKGFQPPKKSLFVNKRLYFVIALAAVIFIVAGILLLSEIRNFPIEDPCKDVRGDELVGGDLLFSKKDLCYRKYAEATGDVRWCSKSRVSGFEYDIRCAINVARATGNIAICDELREDKSACLSEVAEGKNLPQLCSSIPDPYYQRRCEELTSQQSAVDTSNWQTYRNDLYKYEVRYPLGWELPVPEQFRPDTTITNSTDKSTGIRIIVFTGTTAELAVNPTVENIKRYGPETLTEGSVILDGVPGVRVSSTFNQGGRRWIAEYGVVLRRDANIIIGNERYFLASYTIEGVFEAQEDIEIFDQILSTFRFIE